MLLERVWNNEADFCGDKLPKEKKFLERKAAGPDFPRKRKFKHRVRENAISLPRKVIPIDESETDLCAVLWRSVVVQALYDISGHGGNLERRLTRAEGLAWFAVRGDDVDESDFEYICLLADLVPTRILAIAKEVRERGEEVMNGFNFRTLRKDSSVRKGRKHQNKIKQ